MSKSLPPDKIQEMILVMGHHSPSEDSLPKPLTPFTTATYKAGLSETLANDLESFPPGPNSTSGLGPYFMTKFFPSTAGNITMKPSEPKPNGEKNSATSTTDLTCTLFSQVRLQRKLSNGTTIESMLKERKSSTRMPFKRCPNCKSLTGIRNLKSEPMERRTKCIS